MDPTVWRDEAEQALNRLAQLHRVAVGEQVFEEGVLRLDEQFREGLSVRRVPRFGFPGLRHPEIIEEHLLMLFRRREVHFPADHVVGRVRCFGDDGDDVCLVMRLDRDAASRLVDQPK